LNVTELPEGLEPKNSEVAVVEMPGPCGSGLSVTVLVLLLDVPELDELGDAPGPSTCCPDAGNCAKFTQSLDPVVLVPVGCAEDVDVPEPKNSDVAVVEMPGPCGSGLNVAVLLLDVLEPDDWGESPGPSTCWPEAGNCAKFTQSLDPVVFVPEEVPAAPAFWGKRSALPVEFCGNRFALPVEFWGNRSAFPVEFCGNRSALPVEFCGKRVAGTGAGRVPNTSVAARAEGIVRGLTVLGRQRSSRASTRGRNACRRLVVMTCLPWR
jgi:hypothetical protein